MRSSSRLSLAVIPSGLSARQLRRVEEFTGEALSARPTYDDWHNVRRQQNPEPTVAHRSGAVHFSPILAAFLAVLLGSMCLVGLKEHIVRVLPASGALYAAAGLPVNLRGLEFRSVKSDVSEEKSRRILKVSGEITNLRTGLNHVPPIEVMVRGGDGQPLYRWTAIAPKVKLGPNETIVFETRLVAPPEAGQDVKLRFAQAN
jgi:hypothetical protein